LPALIGAVAIALTVSIAGAKPVPVEPGGAPVRVRVSPSPSPSPPVMSPDDIFHRAQKVADANPRPRYMTYQMHEVFVHHGRRFEYDYRVWYRSDGKGLMQNMSPGRHGSTETFYGYPFPFSPDTNILLNATPPPSPGPPPPPVGGLKIPGTPPPILTVESVLSDRYYDVSIVGIEDYRGHPTYHLGLRPVRDEEHHPWKDLWIDVSTFEVWKAHASASGRRGPGAGTIDGEADFSPVGSYWMVANASGDGQVRIGFISDSGHYEYAFSGFSFPDFIPDWYFDEKAFKRHFR
jgi:hypothetical protein